MTLCFLTPSYSYILYVSGCDTWILFPSFCDTTNTSLSCSCFHTHISTWILTISLFPTSPFKLVKTEFLRKKKLCFVVPLFCTIPLFHFHIIFRSQSSWTPHYPFNIFTVWFVSIFNYKTGREIKLYIFKFKMFHQEVSVEAIKLCQVSFVYIVIKITMRF